MKKMPLLQNKEHFCSGGTNGMAGMPNRSALSYDFQDNLLEMQEALGYSYRVLLSKLSPISWIEDVLYNSDEYFIPLRARSTEVIGRAYQIDSQDTLNEVVQMEDILVHGPWTDLPRTVLVEGDAGSGKSTMCDRLAYEWSLGRNKIKELKDFDLVFLIKVCLIDINDKSIYEVIQRELMPDCDCAVIKYVIQRSHVLFILDGYDELSGNKIIVQNLLKKNSCSKATIILTSRYGQIPAPIYFTHAFGLESLSAEDVSKFIQHLSNSKDNYNLSQINLSHHSLGQLLATPLFLWFFALLDGDIFSQVHTANQTCLFKCIIEKILEKAMHRLSSTVAATEEALVQLKSIAYDCKRRDRMHFSDNLHYLTANLGLVKPTTSLQNLNQKTSYAFTHNSILEFLCAQYIADKGSCVDLLNDIPEIVNPRRRTASLIIPFLCGILTDGFELQNVFETFLPIVHSDNSKYDETRVLLKSVETTVAKVRPYYVAEQNTKMVDLADNIQSMVDSGYEDITSINRNDIYYLQGSQSSLIKLANVALSDPDEETENTNYNDHTVNHFGLRCIAEVQDVTLIGNLWESRVSDFIRLYAHRCSHYCSLGIKQLLKLHSPFDLRELMLDYRGEYINNTLGSSKILSSVVDAAESTELMIDGDQNASLWSDLSDYFCDTTLDVITVSRHDTPAPVHCLLKSSHLVFLNCCGSLTSKLTATSADHLHHLWILGYKSTWTKEHAQELQLQLDSHSSLHRTGQCPVNDLICWYIPGNMIPLLVSCSYHHLTRFEIYRLTLTEHDVDVVVECFSKFNCLEKLKMWHIQLENIPAIEDAAQTRLLRGLMKTNCLHYLRHLGIVCHSKEGLSTLQDFLNNPQTNLDTLKYGRVIPLYSEINDHCERQLWCTAIKCSDRIHSLSLYYDDFQSIDIKSTSKLLCSVVDHLTQEQRLQIQWKEIMKVDFRKEKPVFDSVETRRVNDLLSL